MSGFRCSGMENEGHVEWLADAGSNQMFSIDLAATHRYHRKNFEPTGVMHVPLIRLISSALLAVSILVSAATAHAEEQLALNESLADSAIPLTLLTARNITLELVPDDEPTPGDLWVRIRSGFAMRDLDSTLVVRHEKW